MAVSGNGAEGPIGTMDGVAENGANETATAPDIEAANGVVHVVHVIDALILPPESRGLSRWRVLSSGHAVRQPRSPPRGGRAECRGWRRVRAVGHPKHPACTFGSFGGAVCAEARLGSGHA